jgi:hypothetical protein
MYQHGVELFGEEIVIDVHAGTEEHAARRDR